jgi:hypothetical protein
MDWESHTVYTIKKLYEDKDYKDWSDAVQEGDIDGFSSNLKDLLSRLSGVMISEFEIPLDEKRKIMRVLELAAVAGRTI